ncbi:hypothetical protein V6N11_038424 [Hibiscus sabdariffa]|uniref:NAD(P)-binding domain-containing protein n=1 Tax=Hibiscus sabdariffa TaxID=183260 RepID=A0ABR2SJX2_9ROSI
MATCMSRNILITGAAGHWLLWETEEDAVVTKAGAELLVMAYGRETLPIHGNGSNVRSYLYWKDVAEAFEANLQKDEVGQYVYNIGTKKETRVIDVVKDVCKLFSMHPKTRIEFVLNRPFKYQWYFLDERKLKDLGWLERVVWEDGLKKTIDCYTKHPNRWGDVSGTLLLHPRMLMMHGGWHVDSEEPNDLCMSSPERTSSSYDNRPIFAAVDGKTETLSPYLNSDLENIGQR